MIAEGNETPGGESGGTAEGRGRLSEGDILAERRARRAAESGEHALTLRAEAAEATVRTLETHVSSLQQQLRESEEEGRSLSERIDATHVARSEQRAEPTERAYPPSRDAALERELQRASQREYAEQRLRIEAEDRRGEVERETRTELERLGRRLDVSERDAQTLTARLEAAQRELAEAEQAMAAQRAAVLRSERALRERLGELERQAGEIQGGLEAERAARRHAEQMLAELQQAQRSAQVLLGGLAETVARLREAALRPQEHEPSRAPSSEAPLVHAVTEQAPPRAPQPPAVAPLAPAPPPQARPLPTDEAAGSEMAEALAAAVERLRARVEEQVATQAGPMQPSSAKAPPHKHTMSLIARTRLALKRWREQRKQRRTA